MKYNSPADKCNIWANCGFNDTSMKLGRLLEEVLWKKFGYRATPDLTHEQNGGHFSKWPPKCINY